MPNPAESFFESDARIEHLIYVPGSCWDEEGGPDVFLEEFLEGLPDREDAPLYRQLPALAKFRDAEDEPEPWEVVSALFGATGFLIQAATPARHYYGDGASYSSGWGNYWTEWLYAPSEAEIAQVVTAWAEARHAADKTASAAAA